MADATVTFKNVSPLGDLDIPLLGKIVAAGETFEVTLEQAGRPPSGDPTLGTYDPGEGFLAQPSNYEQVSKWTPPAPVVEDFNQAPAAPVEITVDAPVADVPPVEVPVADVPVADVPTPDPTPAP